MITREEYLELKELYNDGYRWIARDSCEIIYAYKLEPIKLGFSWKYSKNNIATTCGDDFLLPYVYVKWEDEKPTKILDLIQDYESHQVIVGENVKVTVPQFVADWIEEVKALERSFKLEILFDTMEMPDDVFDWLDERNGDTDILAKAWIYGYEVEKEKLYIVELPNHQRLAKIDDDIKFYDEREWFEKNLNTKLTRAEIESADPILMQIAIEVE